MILTQVQSCHQAQGHQRLVLHDHVLAGRHGDQVLDTSSPDDRPDNFLDVREGGLWIRARAKARLRFGLGYGSATALTLDLLWRMRADSSLLDSPITPA